MDENQLIYIVEDDTSIRELEIYALKNSNFDVMGFSDGKELAKALENRMADMILLDIMLPGEDGLSILTQLRTSEKFINIPVIMVTAKTSEIDAVKGLDMGADDYITKPFRVMELVSRVKAVLRRTIKPVKKVLTYNNIKLDESKHIVLADNEEVELTYKEYEILKHLIKNKGIVLTRDRLMEIVWGYDFEQGNRTVDVHIQSLRKKLGSAGENIKTIRNVGYKIGE
ncbi:MAG: response regulator transcription factor [Acetobacter sp.]|nr:response regulator transcription factor [Bacteroides sp.]MCM1341812.1 response regulator transcription factor [Acetobacter sp.]MCM1433978.1 response regulator transcription factor [Clostridiales bacterium]